MRQTEQGGKELAIASAPGARRSPQQPTNDAVELGRLMDASHESLRHDFEVCNDGLNEMVRCAREEEACLGARMTGAGFGGCAVALVQTDMGDEVAAAVAQQYEAETDLEPQIYICKASAGTSTVKNYNQYISIDG